MSLKLTFWFRADGVLLEKTNVRRKATGTVHARGSNLRPLCGAGSAWSESEIVLTTVLVNCSKCQRKQTKGKI